MKGWPETRPGAPSLTVGDAAGMSGHFLPTRKGFSSRKLPLPSAAPPDEGSGCPGCP